MLAYMYFILKCDMYFGCQQNPLLLDIGRFSVGYGIGIISFVVNIFILELHVLFLVYISCYLSMCLNF